MVVISKFCQAPFNRLHMVMVGIHAGNDTMGCVINHSFRDM